MSAKPMIGMSPRILRQVPQELGFRGKTLQYLEQSMAHCLMRQGARVAMIPTIERSSEVERWQVDAADYCAAFDGLILQGGADLDPQVYGQDRTHARGPIDVTRDRFELELLRAFTAGHKPVLGVCRGMQLINVAFGGTLHQDLQDDGATTEEHYRAELYDEHSHAIEFVPDGWLSKLYGGPATGKVNSIHHQGVDRLGEELLVEARAPDGVIECVRHARLPFVVGVQWHPEFHDPRFPALMPMEPLLLAFIEAAAASRAIRTSP
ncbi:MAG: gamma-glutamyl-gamma-aminobutyrate hydrolase family protein [Proteobacteria bacterium]|nr:MAG: gamma-glutamyl-gamma-aminobutyrate hydrolase family protein [Pseudomonadota bacterium]